MFLLFVPIGSGWPCPVRTVTGYPCPTCGLTRATRLALHGDLASAHALHPLVWVAAPVFVGAIAFELLGYLRTGRFGASWRLPYAKAVFLGVGVLLFALWIARFFGMFGGPAPRA